MSDLASPRGSVPVPDPTALTTDQLRRELNALKELLTVRIDAVERANEVFSEVISKTPTVLDREISKMMGLFNEKFAGIATQFAERDSRTASDKQAAATGVSAALQAQKELQASQNESNAVAVKKSDDATTKLIDSILLSITANSKGIDDKIISINSRLDRTESITLNARQTQTDNRLNLGSIVGVVGGGVGACGLLITLVVAIMTFARSHNSDQGAITVQQPNASAGIVSGKP